jgi:hypothetical protein
VVFPFQSVELVIALDGTQYCPFKEDDGVHPSPSVQLVPAAKAILLHAQVLLLAPFQLAP